eukprot:Gb_36288 [translate_table: standard]
MAKYHASITINNLIPRIILLGGFNSLSWETDPLSGLWELQRHSDSLSRTTCTAFMRFGEASLNHGARAQALYCFCGIRLLSVLKAAETQITLHKGRIIMASSSTASDDLCISETQYMASPKCCKKSSEDNASGKNVKGGRCLCAPTSHAGSFRCRLHRSSSARWSAFNASGFD